MSGTTLESQELKSEKAKPSKKKIIAITAASVASVLVLSGAGLGLYRSHQVQALSAECKSAVSAAKKSQQSLSDLVASDDVVKALKVSEKQVADKKVISDLKTAVENADTNITFPDCTVQFFDFDTNPVKDVEVTDKTISAKSAAITDAVEAVNKSISAKQFQDAKDKLKKTIESASKVLSDSDGKVADNSTRDNLKKAIDSAKKVLDDKKNTDLKKLSTKALDDAVNAVNASIESKRQADEQAQNNTTQTPSANSWNPGGSTQNWSGSGSQATQPTKPQGGAASSAPTQPQTSTPTQQDNTQTPEWREFPCDGSNCDGWDF